MISLDQATSKTLSGIPLGTYAKDHESFLDTLRDLYAEQFCEDISFAALTLNVDTDTLFSAEVRRLDNEQRVGEVPALAISPTLSFAVFGLILIDRFMKEYTEGRDPEELLARFDLIVDAREQTILGSASKRERAVISEIARKNARRRHKLDPKQGDKAFVHDCWTEWQRDQSKYPTVAAFARDMLEKTEYLVSTDVIERWVRLWRTKSIGS